MLFVVAMFYCWMMLQFSLHFGWLWIKLNQTINLSYLQGNYLPSPIFYLLVCFKSKKQLDFLVQLPLTVSCCLEVEAQKKGKAHVYVSWGFCLFVCWMKFSFQFLCKSHTDLHYLGGTTFCNSHSSHTAKSLLPAKALLF